MNDRLSPFALALALFAALASAAWLPLDELSKSQRKKLGKAFSNYFEAEQDELLEMRGKIEEEIAKIDEKAERPVLSEVEALQEILLEARDRSDRVDGKGRTAEFEIERGTFETTATVRAPKSYKGSKQAYPLVIVIPDEGQSAEEALRDDWNQPAAIEEAVFCVVEMPDDTDKWSGFGDSVPGGVYYVMFSFGAMLETYSIHPDRVFLAGRGAGAGAAVEIAATFPDRFAGVVALSGDVDETPADNFGAIATLFVGAGANAADFGKRAEELEYGNSTSAPNMSGDDIWAWIAEQRRTAHPTEVRFAPRDERASDAYWIKGLGVDMSKASLVATADRETNTITIEGSGIGSVVVRFNDALVDLSEPVRVIVNGLEVERRFDRNLGRMLERVATSSDPARIYVADSKFDFPAASE